VGSYVGSSWIIHRRMLARELGVGKVSHWASIRTFAIVTTDANELVADIQTRSPVPRRRGDVSEEPEDQGADQVSHGCAHRCRVSARGRIATQQVILGDEAGEVTPASADFLSKLGVDLSGARGQAPVFCRPGVDWTERRPHIGGAVGAGLANRCFGLKWIERVRDSRALTITPAGRRALVEAFALSI
jgi:hypothetical protein